MLYLLILEKSFIKWICARMHILGPRNPFKLHVFWEDGYICFSFLSLPSKQKCYKHSISLYSWATKSNHFSAICISLFPFPSPPSCHPVLNFDWGMSLGRMLTESKWKQRDLMKQSDLYEVMQFRIDARKFPLSFSNIHKINHATIAALVILDCALVNRRHQGHTGI